MKRGVGKWRRDARVHYRSGRRTCVLTRHLVRMLGGAGKNAGDDGWCWTVLLLAMQRSAEVHQATIIERRAILGVGGEHVVQLGVEHRRRNFGILDGKRPAESAAAVKVRERESVRVRAPC